jgi:hypothetical protein
VATVSTIAFPSCGSLAGRTVATSPQSCRPTKCASGPWPGAKTWGPSLSTTNIHDLDMRPWVRNFKNILLPRTSMVCGPEISKDHVCHHLPSHAIPLCPILNPKPWLFWRQPLPAAVCTLKSHQGRKGGAPGRGSHLQSRNDRILMVFILTILFVDNEHVSCIVIYYHILSFIINNNLFIILVIDVIVVITNITHHLSDCHRHHHRHQQSAALQGEPDPC